MDETTFLVRLEEPDPIVVGGGAFRRGCVRTHSDPIIRAGDASQNAQERVGAVRSLYLQCKFMPCVVFLRVGARRSVVRCSFALWFLSAVFAPLLFSFPFRLPCFPFFFFLCVGPLVCSLVVLHS